MMRRTLALALTMFLGLAGYASTALAQSDSGEISIVVTDASTKAPIELARVLLDGPVITSEFSGKNGQVRFTQVPDGIYTARVAKRGFQTATSVQFEIVGGRAVTVSVSLAADQVLKTIGTVTVKSTASVSASSISSDSAQRKLSDDLAGALNKLSGVSVSTTGDDSGATQTVSLEGHDASQTALTVDGIPLNAPGTAGNLRQFSSDLFTGASVRFGPQIGGLGGSVGFRTLDPTLTWQSSTSLSVGSNGKYNYSFGESGTDGKVGVAAMATYRATPSLIDGMQFLDASGLDYTHEGDSASTGEMLKLRYNLSDAQALTASYLGSGQSTGLVCLRITGALPCGYGPNNTNNGNFSLFSLSDNALVGDTTFQASVYGSNSKTTHDLLDRFVNGVAQPTGFADDTRTAGFSLSAELPARERHTISLQAYGSTNQTTTTPLVAEAIPFYNSAQRTNYAALQVTDSVHSNTKLTLSDSFGISSGSNSPASVLGSIGATWKPTDYDTYSASYAIGGVGGQGGRSTILSEPQSLSFDCNGNVAYGAAPGDQPSATSSTSARVGYTHSWRGGTISGSLYRQVQNGVVLPTQVNGSVLAATGIFPPGYFGDVQAIYDSPAGCNAPPGTPFGPQNVYFSTPIGNVKRVYEGGSLTGFVTLGNLVVQPYYNLTVSSAVSNDPRINNPYSIVISGGQLPNVPLHRAGFVLDYKSPGSALEWLFDAQYTGANNQNNLPAFTTYDAGVSAQLPRGTLTLAASNITNAFGGVFASSSDAVPYQTLGGMIIPTIARPLAPRQYSVTYSARFGQGGLIRTGSAASALTGGTQGQGGTGGQGGQGGARRFGNITPLPQTPPADPLGIVSSAQCTPADATAAHAVLDPLKAYVAQIEAAKSAAGYPGTMAAPDIASLAVTYHGLGSTYALTLAPKGGAQIRSMFVCAAMHFAQAADVKAHSLYQPKSTLFVPSLSFMPAVGLYLVARAPQAGQESFRLYKLPTTPPANPFALVSSTQCTADAKRSAQQVLAELRGYFQSNANAPSWKITPHTAKSGTWYELEPNDVSTLPAVLTCGHVSAASKAELTQLGYDGARPPSLGYSPALGIYLQRNDTHNGQGQGQPQP